MASSCSTIPTFDERCIREAVLNAVSHRDYRLGASVFIRQYPRRIEVESPGGFPPGISEQNVLDLIRQGRPIPAPLEGRVSVLVDNGIVERISRSKGRRYLLSRRFHQFLGESGVYTRKRGLDRDTNKELLCKHIADNARMGAQMDSLRQVLPHLSRSQIQVLLRELTKAGRVHHHGATRAARWYPGPETPDCNHTGA